ncbi:MAG TPA: hypothetical protein VHT52_23085, partial [Stellaceae bacterium]|nr:hypothetical protein [Stellaceae bacterium]
PAKPLQLRTSTRRFYGTKVRGKIMEIDPSPHTELLEQDVRELNTFLGRFDLRGGVHSGFVRIFNQGDDEEFDWNKGGRLEPAPAN